MVKCNEDNFEFEVRKLKIVLNGINEIIIDEGELVPQITPECSLKIDAGLIDNATGFRIKVRSKLHYGLNDAQHQNSVTFDDIFCADK